MTAWANTLTYPCYVVLCGVDNVAPRVALVHSAADLEDRWQTYPGHPEVYVFAPAYYERNPE